MVLLSGREIQQPSGFPGLPQDWVAEGEHFKASNGTVSLFAINFHRAVSGPRVLVVFHGMGEYGGRYAHLPHFLKEQVDSVYCPDLRGHGRSEGIRGHIDRFDSFSEDGAAIIRRLDGRLKEQFGKSEIHVLGHSLGGHIVLRTLFLNPELPIRSATVSAPFLGIKSQIPAAKKAAVFLLAKLAKAVPLATDLDADGLSRDPAVVKLYKEDPLNHDKMTPGFFFELLAAFGDTLSRTDGIRVPIQFLIPMADRIVEEEKAIAFFDVLKQSDKRLRSYPDFFHEPMNEIGKERVLADILSWIQSH
ncbi:MAG: hypothetical protein A2428_02810 [Bdellovibrionales bacterium RIFOXYC1_FULL_54_43]|nr:MAG: hypothetical protein A2428_02810 [Bdellovibrionales bacterium RIFOXYC1_FULL_54_43]OFZ81033.1 MAG: hypothetical protein A2603_04630 [Bdellovibrionales bacterium RIFOXYD1_FULL_55_31]